MFLYQKDGSYLLRKPEEFAATWGNCRNVAFRSNERDVASAPAHSGSAASTYNVIHCVPGRMLSDSGFCVPSSYRLCALPQSTPRRKLTTGLLVFCCSCTCFVRWPLPGLREGKSRSSPGVRGLCSLTCGRQSALEHALYGLTPGLAVY